MQSILALIKKQSCWDFGDIMFCFPLLFSIEVALLKKKFSFLLFAYAQSFVIFPVSHSSKRTNERPVCLSNTRFTVLGACSHKNIFGCINTYRKLCLVLFWQHGWSTATRGGLRLLICWLWFPGNVTLTCRMNTEILLLVLKMIWFRWHLI